MSRQGASPMPSALETSSSVASCVQIGSGSYSPGDVYVECILPFVEKRGSRVAIGDTLLTSSSSKFSLRQSQLSLHSDENTGCGILDADETCEGNENDDPDGANVYALRDHPVILQAQDECENLMNGNYVVVLEDEDVKEDVVQVMGKDAELVFACHNIFRFLVLFIKDVGQFMDVQVEILDDKQVYRHLKLTNARSLAKVEATSCQVPLVVGTSPGWRYLCIDLMDLTKQAFGTKHVTTTQVRIGASCRVLRVFFQDERYSDAELPSYLTFLG